MDHVPGREGRIGPNAVIQVAAALRAAGGDPVARRVFADAGLERLLDKPPTGMVEERLVARLHRTLFASFPPETAAELADTAGMRTGDYILANRIPAPAQWLLRILPAPLAARLLLEAIRRNAWTFAGSGAVTVHAGRPAAIEIERNPICTPGCRWHCGVFRRLFEVLVSPKVSVSECACDRVGVCRFEISY